MNLTLEDVIAWSGLTEEEKEMLRNLDWRALIRYGVIFFILEKLGAAVGVSNQDIYAAMRGETLEEFLATRPNPVTYNVAGVEDEQEDGDAKS